MWLLPGIGLLTCGTANVGVDYIAAVTDRYLLHITICCLLPSDLVLFRCICSMFRIVGHAALEVVSSTVIENSDLLFYKYMLIRYMTTAQRSIKVLCMHIAYSRAFLTHVVPPPLHWTSFEQ